MINTKGFIAIVFVVVITILVGVSVLLYQQKNKTDLPPVVFSTPLIQEGLPSDYYVSFANVYGDILLRYKDKVYKQAEGTADPQEVKLDEMQTIKWETLVELPINSPVAKFFIDELFDFKLLPNKNDFLFTMRWSQQDGARLGQDFKVFYYDSGVKSVKNIFSSVLPTEGQFVVPKINKISLDSMFVAFAMYGCWNCGGHQPETLLMNVKTGQTKRLGKVSYFSWKENGAYEFKEFKEKECLLDQRGPGICAEEPETLPLRYGQMK